MADDKKISQLTVAGTLDGSETLEIVQGGANKKTTTQDIAALGGGGGGAVDSVNGQTGVVVLDAGDVGADPTGSSSTVQTNLTAHINDTSAAHAASAISFSATGGISSTDVQAAISELDTEKLRIANTASALTDAASIDITGAKHTLSTNRATITFTQSFTGDDTRILVTFNTTSATWTFPTGTLCITEGSATGTNSATVTGVSGDLIVISTWFVSSGVYITVIKNAGQ
jgi:hypothetical protein